MTDLSAINNDYAQTLYRVSTLNETEETTALKGSRKETAKTAASRAAPGMSESDVAESHELGVLPQQKPVVLKDAALYKNMLGQLPNSLQFDMSKVMAVVFKSMLSMMKSQSAARMSDLALAGEANIRAARQMKSAATMELTGAVLGASMKIAGAGLTMAGAAYNAKAESPAEFNSSMKPFTAGNEMLDSGGSMLKAGMDYAGKVESANSDLSKAAATHAHAIREYDDELYKEAQKFADQMLQIIQSIEQQQHAASSQILSA